MATAHEIAGWRGLKQRIGSDRLLRNVGALGMFDLVARVTRIVTTIVVARMMTAVDLGVAAMALATFELIRTFANTGVAQMVIRAPIDRLAATCASAYRASWLVCIVLALLQVGAGLAIAWTSGRADLPWLLGCLAGVYLVMPFGLVQAFLLMRDGDMVAIAKVSVVQALADSALTAILAVLGFGAWAIVLPKLITAPIWLIGIRAYRSWPRDGSAGYIPTRDMLAFAAPVLGSEAMVAVRNNVDKLLVVAVLGTEALGLYYFAFNAGIGLSMSLTTALSASIYPHLAEVARRPRELIARFDRALWRTALPIGILIALQAVAALLYVPVLFGMHWAHAAPLVTLLCVSAITRPASEATTQLLRAAGLPAREMLAAAIFTIVYLGTFALLLPHGLYMAIGGITAVATALQLAFTFWGRNVIAAGAEDEQPTSAGATADVSSIASPART